MFARHAWTVLGVQPDDDKSRYRQHERPVRCLENVTDRNEVGRLVQEKLA